MLATWPARERATCNGSTIVPESASFKRSERGYLQVHSPCTAAEAVVGGAVEDGEVQARSD